METKSQISPLEIIIPTILTAVLLAILVVTIKVTTRGVKEISEKMPESSMMTNIQENLGVVKIQPM